MVTLSFLIVASCVLLAFAVVGVVTAFAFSPLLAGLGLLIVVVGAMSVFVDFAHEADEVLEVRE